MITATSVISRYKYYHSTKKEVFTVEEENHAIKIDVNITQQERSKSY